MEEVRINPIYEMHKQELLQYPKTWLVTGVAGFIGSHLLTQLLSLNQKVIGVDNFITGTPENLEDVRIRIGENWKNFHFVKGDIRDFELCKQVSSEADFVLHQAALGSVPRSIENPLNSHDNNVNGSLNILLAACQNKNVKRLVYASSSSVYGASPDLPKRESVIGKPLSPYAVTKLVTELYAQAFANCYQMTIVGLRYFNVFGIRQNPNGPYAAVIPKWIDAMSKNQSIHIYGDGQTSRDFCYIDNVVQANILAALSIVKEGAHVYNVAVGQTASLNELFAIIQLNLQKKYPHVAEMKPNYSDFRKGDILHSLADIKMAQDDLGYDPLFNLGSGIENLIALFSH